MAKASEVIYKRTPSKHLKKIEVYRPKTSPASASDLKQVKPIPSNAHPVPFNEIKSVASTSTRPRKKSDYVQQPANSTKKQNITKQQPVKKQQNMPSTKPSGEIKRPHRWRSQVHDGSYNAESDIVIGFDFGTSSSKIVIRDSGRQTAYAVPFGRVACSENRYLIPTKIFISNEGKVSLSEGDYSYDSLKVQLIDNPMQNFIVPNTSQSITASELAAAYMSLVIRFSRDWFLEQTESIYKKTNIHWHINLGVPSENYDDNGMRKTFQTIAMTSWRLSRLDTVITIADVKKYLKEADAHISPEGKNINPDNPEALWLHPDLVNTHPEVIMEVVGCARSPLGISGLHLLIDVGATTLDAATFIVYSPRGEYVFSLLKTKVARLGTMELHKSRIKCIDDRFQRTLKELKELKEKKAIDPTKPLPERTYYEIQPGKDDLYENDKSFLHECSAKIGETIRETKNRRDPYSRAWEKGLPVFICGGGGRLSSYREMISALGIRIAENLTDFIGFDIKEIPKPTQLKAPELPPKEYDRLAVAYGLSFTSAEIGEVIPESKISDIHKEVKVSSIDDLYVGKDMC